MINRQQEIEIQIFQHPCKAIIEFFSKFIDFFFQNQVILYSSAYNCNMLEYYQNYNNGNENIIKREEKYA